MTTLNINLTDDELTKLTNLVGIKKVIESVNYKFTSFFNTYKSECIKHILIDNIQFANCIDVCDVLFTEHELIEIYSGLVLDLDKIAKLFNYFYKHNIKLYDIFERVKHKAQPNIELDDNVYFHIYDVYPKPIIHYKFNKKTLILNYEYEFDIEFINQVEQLLSAFVEISYKQKYGTMYYDFISLEQYELVETKIKEMVKDKVIELNKRINQFNGAIIDMNVIQHAKFKDDSLSECKIFFKTLNNITKHFYIHISQFYLDDIQILNIFKHKINKINGKYNANRFNN